MKNKKIMYFIVTLLSLQAYAVSSEDATATENQESSHTYPPCGSDPSTWTPKWLLDDSKKS